MRTESRQPPAGRTRACGGTRGVTDAAPSPGNLLQAGHERVEGLGARFAQLARRLVAVQLHGGQPPFHLRNVGGARGSTSPEHASDWSVGRIYPRVPRPIGPSGEYTAFDWFVVARPRRAGGGPHRD
eukprot:1188396-Prorocentrum_minimum.AAC.4